MAAVARKLLEVIDRGVQSRHQTALASDDAVGVESPALALQQLVERSYMTNYPEPYIEKWPPAVRLLLLAGLAVSSWSLLIVGARALLRLT